MFGFWRDKERDRYYLLPGMGGRAARRKHRIMLIWALVAGVLTSGIVGLLIYLLSSQR